MSKRLTGLNPLAYIGVEALTPPQMYLSERAPTTGDAKNFNLGDMWLDKSTQNLYVLVSLSAGIATWVSGSGATTFVTDSGSAVDAGGIINIVGGDDIDTTGSGNTITIDLADNISLDGLQLVGQPNGVLLTDATGVVTAQNGNDGQLLIGGGTAPAWADVISSDATINVVVGNNILDLQVDSVAVLDAAGTTDGQILIADTGGVPAWANITSLDTSITITNGANSIDLSAPTATGLTTVNTDSGAANQAAGAINLVGDGVTIETSGATDTATISMINGTNGQLLIGGGANPVWANLTSGGGTVTITNGVNSINLEAMGGGSSGASNFITDSGTAVQNLGDIDIVGGNNISTSGAGQTVTIDVSGTTNHAIQVGNASGSLTSLSAATNGQLPIGSTGANPVVANLTAGSGIQITNGAGSITIAATGGGGGGGVLVTPFLASGTWTKNVDTKYVEVWGWNGGGGGGSGSVHGAGVVAQGGGGGGCGSFFRFSGPAQFFGATATVTVGVGGTGAAGQTINNTGGLLGGNGTASVFGSISAPIIGRSASGTPPSFQGGGGGQTFQQDIASGSGSIFADGMTTRFSSGVGLGNLPVQYGLGGRSSVAVGADGAFGGGEGANSYRYLYFQGTPGGQGGSVTSGNVASAGGEGGTMYALDGSTVLSAGGTAGAAGGTNGGNGVDYPNNPLTDGGFVFGGTGGGGGGSGAAGGGDGGDGGDGAFPGGGGGGGGGARNGSTSGAGGNGGDGLVIVIEWT